MDGEPKSETQNTKKPLHNETLHGAELRELIRLSNYYGGNPDFVLAGGGNTSYKSGDVLFVKASGVPLAGITSEGFVRMDRSKLKALWQRDYSATADPESEILHDILACRQRGEEHKRPSVETLLHDLLPLPYVVHTHHCLINGLTCAKQGEQTARELFGERVIWVPVTKPGYTTARRIREEIGSYRERFKEAPHTVLIQNHGVFIAGESFEKIKNQTDALIEALQSRIEVKPDTSAVETDREVAAKLAPVLRMLLMGEAETSIVVFRVNQEILGLLESRDAFYPVSSAFTPDHIVYYGHPPLFVPLTKDMEKLYRTVERQIEQYRNNHSALPRIVAVEKLGVFACGRSKREADTALALFEDAVKISAYTKSFGGPLFMPPEHIAFIKDWEAEHYRKKVAAEEGGKRLASERIAIVTGSAQGIGLGIAEALIEEGASVIIADINSSQAEQQASRLCDSYEQGKALAVAVDVGKEDSVHALITEAVLHFGGIDLFVSNAGILRAGSLEEMDLSAFDLVTHINYTAFFLCAKYASELMKLQHRFRPGYSMDIVQINSKSGLKGSNKNFAYAGSKFGGLGLTQSFALELVEYNIKVNAICPGNYFDGPLWSDPQRGLFTQYLKAGKVPGAKSMEDVRRYYEAQIPMGRGCEIKDIARALFYVLEQEYETGQAVPVTGGQIMLG
jgi:NAD(P)-dependent dehydrogenase (short-subunit alcohol dehydrogenase family)/rhamnose utilization protein RhaD (predicted bifunctional aldolase and dehydrogenase)